MAKISKAIKVMYATTALSGAIGFYLLGATPVVAESVENATRWMNSREAKEAQIDTHLQSTDKSIEELKTEQSRIIGFGLGISGTLGVLQILGFLAERTVITKG